MNLFYEDNANRFIFASSSNMSFPEHIHIGMELYYMEKGALNITIGTETKRMLPGDFAIAFPNQIHAYGSIENETENLGMMILCPAEMSGEFLPQLMKYHAKHPFLTKDEVHSDVIFALRSLLKTPPDVPENRPLIRAYIQLILAHVLPLLSLEKNKDNQPPGLTAQLIAYLSEHYTEPIQLDHIAEHLGISKYSVSRIFSEKLHSSFSKYVNTLRIDYAKYLLQGSDMDILSISELCGYDNPRTFNREFKSICGCQPREFRRT
ncbi:AraC family transcriptional regulator [Lachnospiraceae bacterium OttesenSCG-928-D06]|nr:AraC family transcriptional regulator [Lachnospiraceae bacterium OttesenSCG-928-D06]